MMKMRKIIAICVLTAMMTGLFACGSPEPAGAENSGDTEEKNTVTTEVGQKEEQGQEMKVESAIQTPADGTENKAAQGPVTFTLYNSNDDATALVQETVEVDALTKENVLAALIECGILQDDIRILSLEVADQDGEKVLNIDFSQEFGSYVASMGTAGEYMIMGSVSNTFLSAYGCEKVKITVEGGVLSTGHQEYTGYYGYYE